VKQLEAEEDTERPSSALVLYKRRGDEKALAHSLKEDVASFAHP
jgi:hypothetical protein